jgi:ketosteroid isomerase-like protein
MLIREHIAAMFEAIDSSEWGKLPEFFEAGIVYQRPGYPLLNGIGELDHFYRYQRKIACGKHMLRNIVAEGNCAVAIGTFKGKLKDGAATQVQFSDAYWFRSGLIYRRQTFFDKPAV